MTIVSPIGAPVILPSTLPGVNVLLEGPTGTGKTYSIGTAADAGIDVFVLFLEAGVETLAGYWTDKGKPIPPNVHWHVLERPKGSFEVLSALAININSLAYDQLLKVRDSNIGIYLKLYTDFLGQLINFTDQRTGVKYGAVDSWGPDKLFVLDGLTGLTELTTYLRIGGTPVKSQSDIGIIQEQIRKTLKQLTDGCKCHFVLIGHVEREIVLEGLKITFSTIGKALAPVLPPMFSDIILAQRLASNYTWSTSNSQADLKTRNLPLSDQIQPDFGAIFSKWKSRGGVFSPEVKR